LNPRGTPGVRDSKEGMLTRAEMSKALGMSKTTLRRWEDKGKLKPIVDPAGVHLFRKQDALALNGGKLPDVNYELPLTTITLPHRPRSQTACPW
jgi:hypothetical protein